MDRRGLDGGRAGNLRSALSSQVSESFGTGSKGSHVTSRSRRALPAAGAPAPAGDVVAVPAVAGPGPDEANSPLHVPPTHVPHVLTRRTTPQQPADARVPAAA
ncbi:hypothetical protein GCM10009610_24490 [Pseudonocardia xinjiangensis]